MTVDPVPAMSCMASVMTLRKASASQEALSRSKKKAWCSSSGRTYSACSRAVGTETSPTRSRSRPSCAVYSSHTARQRRHTSCTSGWFQASGLTESRVRASASGSGESGSSGCLKRAGGDIDAEAVDAPVQPEPQCTVEVRADLGVAPVPVGLFGREHVQVPLARAAVRLGHPAPGRAAEHGVPVVGRLGAVRSPPVGEVEPGPGGTARRRGQRLTEPGVLAGAVVGDDVEQHLDAQPPGGRHQPVELGEVAEERVDVAVVGDVVAVVGLRGGVEGAQPDPVDTQLLQVRQSGADSGEIADAVAGAVQEAADVHLVDHCLTPPVVRVVARFDARVDVLGAHPLACLCGLTVMHACYVGVSRRCQRTGSSHLVSADGISDPTWANRTRLIRGRYLTCK